MATYTAIPNHQKRSFTIRMDDGTKYRTSRMTKKEFNDLLENTSNDWANWLRTSQDYKIIR